MASDEPADVQASQDHVRVQGPRKASEADHREHLLSQLRAIPSDAAYLFIEEDTPSDAEWAILSAHFHGVRDLTLDSGWNEELNDGPMPTHWPLERLVLGSACGEVVRTPLIREGAVAHLALVLTCELRFEGPTTEELQRAHAEAVARGGEEAEYVTTTVGEGEMAEERRIQITSLPELVAKWMREQQQQQQQQQPQQEQLQQEETTADGIPVSQTQPSSSALTKLEIIENDAIDTFTRMTLALPHLITNLKTLHLRSTHGLDFHLTSEQALLDILPTLTGLRTLVLSVAEIFEDSETYLPTLICRLPPNLTTLRFRGPAALARYATWDGWLRAVERRDILANLERLSFVLDLGYDDDDDDDDDEEEEAADEAADERLRVAKTACRRLYDVVERHGVVVEPFCEKWAEVCGIIRPVSERWDQV